MNVARNVAAGGEEAARKVAAGGVAAPAPAEGIVAAVAEQTGRVAARVTTVVAGLTDALRRRRKK